LHASKDVSQVVIISSVFSDWIVGSFLKLALIIYSFNLESLARIGAKGGTNGSGLGSTERCLNLKAVASHMVGEHGCDDRVLADAN
jgi:hypothetical protein